MGFKDPDRKTPEHDRACIDLATSPIGFLQAAGLVLADVSSPSVYLEVPLQKGDGKYASTVGFIDAVVTYGRPVGEDADWWACGRGMDWTRSGPKHDSSSKDRCLFWTPKSEWSGECGCSRDRFQGPSPREWHRCSWVVEVKSSIDNVGDLLRQMNLYREYKKEHNHSHVEKFVIWTLSDSDAKFRDLLVGQGYDLVIGRDL